MMNVCVYASIRSTSSQVTAIGAYIDPPAAPTARPTKHPSHNSPNIPHDTSYPLARTADAQGGLALLRRVEGVLDLEELARAGEGRQREAVRRVAARHPFPSVLAAWLQRGGGVEYMDGWVSRVGRNAAAVGRGVGICMHATRRTSGRRRAFWAIVGFSRAARVAALGGPSTGNMPKQVQARGRVSSFVWFGRGRLGLSIGAFGIQSMDLFEESVGFKRARDGRRRLAPTTTTHTPMHHHAVS